MVIEEILCANVVTYSIWPSLVFVPELGGFSNLLPLNREIPLLAITDIHSPISVNLQRRPSLYHRSVTWVTSACLGSWPLPPVVQFLCLWSSVWIRWGCRTWSREKGPPSELVWGLREKFLFENERVKEKLWKLTCRGGKTEEKFPERLSLTIF